MYFFLLLILGLPVHASSCIDIVNRIEDDITKYAFSFESQHFNWMNLSWLQKNLGPAQVEKTSGDQVQYKWQCNSYVYLVVQTNSAGKLISINGSFSSDNGAGLFDANLVKLASQQNAFKKPAIVIHLKPSPQEMKLAYQQKLETFNQEIRDYNYHFNTFIKNLDQLQSDMTNRIKAFSEKLRLCTPGTYQYAIAALTDILYLTTTIKGKQGDLCITETSYSMYGLGSVYMNCQFQPQNLQYVADHYPELTLINAPINTENWTNKGQAINDCKTTTTGLLQQIDKNNKK